MGLPRQNLIAIALISLAGEWGTAWAMRPRQSWRDTAIMTLAWAAGVLIARSLARLALRRFRGGRYWGSAAIALAAFFTALAQFALTRAGGEAVGRFFSTALLLVFLTPWFVRKERFSALPNR
ncbi:MAG TPA: hypothetical protein VHB20_00675 [Verrucomicrobiae bacterium]|jgi:hypothetical protein|nr:hypothetical protein [Verrucomicrobiae bacterium]